MAEPTRYPWLNPALRQLSGDALEIWGDARVRAGALEAIVRAWEDADGTRLDGAIRRVDDAVVAGLDALELPRGPTAGVRIERIGRLWLGRKEASCILRFDADTLQVAIREQRIPDDVFRVWVHESLHGRKTYSVADTAVHRRTRGYEEGMVEGLARLVTRGMAQMRPIAASYNYYVGAYEALATVMGVTPEELWRWLWRAPCGMVREAFVEAVDNLRVAVTGLRLTPIQGARLQALADQAFVLERADDAIGDRELLRARWRLVFR